MLFAIDDRNPTPLFEQIVSQIKGAVAEGKLEIGQSLPGVRELADGLGVNLHTVHKAYQRLRDQGVIELRLGKRAQVGAASARRGNAWSTRKSSAGSRMPPARRPCSASARRNSAGWSRPSSPGSCPKD